jgi:hypothetical protein
MFATIVGNCKQSIMVMPYPTQSRYVKLSQAEYNSVRYYINFRVYRAGTSEAGI